MEVSEAEVENLNMGGNNNSEDMRSEGSNSVKECHDPDYEPEEISSMSSTDSGFARDPFQLDQIWRREFKGKMNTFE